MLIVCTQDPTIIAWTQSQASNSAAWGNVKYITVGQNQAAATLQFERYISLLAANEPLCLSAHGNDTEIGDAASGGANWGWTATQIAAMLNAGAAGNQGPILTSVCSKNISNFSANLAVTLKQLGAMHGVWIYGYNRATSTTQPYPSPSTLSKQVDLQGTQVG